MSPSTEGKGRSRGSSEPGAPGRAASEEHTLRDAVSFEEAETSSAGKIRCRKIKGITVYFETGERAEEKAVFQSDARRTIIEGKAMWFNIQQSIQN